VTMSPLRPLKGFLAKLLLARKDSTHLLSGPTESRTPFFRLFFKTFPDAWTLAPVAPQPEKFLAGLEAFYFTQVTWTAPFSAADQCLAVSHFPTGARQGLFHTPVPISKPRIDPAKPHLPNVPSSGCARTPGTNQYRFRKLRGLPPPLLRILICQQLP